MNLPHTVRLNTRTQLVVCRWPVCGGSTCVCVCVCWRLCVVCRAVAAAAAAWRCHAPQIYVSLIDQLSSAPVSHTTLQTFFWRQVIAEIYCLLAWFSPFSDKTWCLRRPVYGFHERKIKATRNLVIANRSRVSCAYVTGMIFQGHLRSSEMSRFDSAYMISYCGSIVTMVLSLSFSRNSELMVENREFCIPQLYFNAPVRDDPIGISRRCFVLRKLDRHGYSMLKKVDDTLSHFGYNAGTWQTDGQIYSPASYIIRWKSNRIINENMFCD